MTPFQKKIRSLGRRKFLPEWFQDLPPRLEADILEQLVIKLRKGDKSTINPIIEGHMRLGVSIAGRYGYKYPTKIDDLIGVMQLALTYSTRIAKYKLTNNVITPYLVSRIHSALLRFIEDDHIVKVPGRTVRYYFEKGDVRLETLPMQTKMCENSGEGNHEDIMDNGNNSSFNNDGYIYVPQIFNEELKIVDLNEVIDKVTRGYIEKRVIELRAKGYSYEDISPQVGCSVSKISIIVRTVEEKFNEIYGTGT